MSARLPSKISIMTCLLLALVWASPAFATVMDANSYPITVDMLTQLHADSLTAWQLHNAYERQARNEGFPGVANLFAAMAASQAIIVNRLQGLLTENGIGPMSCLNRPQTVQMTRDNLRSAIEIELRNTDETFPNALKQVTNEGHAPAIQFLQTAIDVKRHHRDKLAKIHAYSGYFFRALTAKIDRQNPRYFVCSWTGAVIVNELPATCPIRGGVPSSYVELVKLKASTHRNTCSPV